jgi:hypothetical protein
VDLRVGTEDVVVGEDVPEAELLDALGVRTDGAHVGTDLGLGEHGADLHGSVLPAKLARVTAGLLVDRIDVTVLLDGQAVIYLFCGLAALLLVAPLGDGVEVSTA